MATPSILAELPKYAREAVRFYWETRSRQLQKQRDAGGSDRGSRSAVTGGAQMNGFIELLTKLVIEAGIDRAHIYYDQALELPGYFRPNKKWDFIVNVNGQLVAALKANVSSDSFSADDRDAQGAICDALDLWAAYRTSPSSQPRPWVGLLMFREEALPSNEQRTEISPQAQKCMAFCRRLFLERIYDSAAVMLCHPEAGSAGEYSDLGDELTFHSLATSLFMQAAVFSGKIVDMPRYRPIAC